MPGPATMLMKSTTSRICTQCLLQTSRNSLNSLPTITTTPAIPILPTITRDLSNNTSKYNNKRNTRTFTTLRCLNARETELPAASVGSGGIGGQRQKRTFASKSRADDVIEEITELYATARDEFEIASEESSKHSIYAKDDRAAAREELAKLLKRYHEVIGSEPEPNSDRREGREGKEGIEGTERSEGNKRSDGTAGSAAKEGSKAKEGSEGKEVAEEVKRRIGSRIRELERAVEVLNESDFED